MVTRIEMVNYIINLNAKNGYDMDKQTKFSSHSFHLVNNYSLCEMTLIGRIYI